MNKGTISIVVIALISAVALFLLVNKENKYKEIEKYVNDNYQELEKVAGNYQNNKKADYDKEHIINIEVTENKIVNFIVDNSKTTYGFYYSSENKPTVYQDTDKELIQTYDREWIWSKNKSKGKTKQIRENWFYFESTKEK